MKCHKCGKTISKVTGNLHFEDAKIGSFEVYNVEYYKCDGCGRLFFPEETLITIETKEAEQKKQLLSQLPISDFIGAKEAAAILDISRQALHKHRRIRRGFIYSIKFEGRAVYNKKSVELFKETGDGRFPLIPQQTTITVEYPVISRPVLGIHEYSEGSNTLDSCDWFYSETLPYGDNQLYQTTH